MIEVKDIVIEYLKANYFKLKKKSCKKEMIKFNTKKTKKKHTF